MIDVKQKKAKIIEFLSSNGPSLPVQIARAIQMDPVFASAILSEILSTKEIKTSHMKIGSSPLYLLPTQEKLLEEKTENLKSMEREAQEKLKSKKILIDENEEPAIRVALRNIKDFAIPFKFQDKITWKYAFAPQEEINEILFPKKETTSDPKKESSPEKEEEQKEQPSAKEEQEVPKAWEAKKTEIYEAKEKSKKIENIFTKETNQEKPTKKQQTFLEEIEQHLKHNNTTITAIEEVDKKKVVAIVKSEETKSMLFAFNKARVTESELLKCYKEANKKNLPYQIITKTGQTKKLLDTIQAYQKLLKISKLENTQP